MNKIDPELRSYIEEQIIPRYAEFDKAHRADHVNMVISQSLKLASSLADIDRNMAYAAAAFHDLGLVNGRENHHVDSRRILESDEFIKAHFSAEEIRLMGEAVEDHRASKSGRPRNIYGLIVAEADRFIDGETIVRRAIQYGLRNYPQLDREGHFERTVGHLTNKYGPDGYLKIWLPQSDNATRLDQLRRLIADATAIRAIFDRIYNEETNSCPMATTKNLIFDFDGTLVDTAPLIIRTMQETMRELGLPERGNDECRATIGLRLEEIPAVLWPDRPGLGPEYATTYRRIFDRLKRPLSVSCYPGVIETLRRLKDAGLRMAIASSRNQSSLREYAELFGIDDCFEMIVGGDDVAAGKPAPDPVLAILGPLQWQADETLTIGDAAVDILMGRAAGTRTCAVTYGNGTAAELRGARPDYMIASFPALTEIVTSNL